VALRGETRNKHKMFMQKPDKGNRSEDPGHKGRSPWGIGASGSRSYRDTSFRDAKYWDINLREARVRVNVHLQGKQVHLRYYYNTCVSL